MNTQSGLQQSGIPERGAGRFAPTPTGNLHLGNVRTALCAWLSARSKGLRNILRVEDLDPQAIPAGCLEGIYEDLDWLGLRYDECPRRGGAVGPYRQSERFSQYDDVLARLGELGLLYPCWCSRKEVRAAAIAPHASDEGPIYAGTCRPTQMQVLGDLDRLPERKGRKPALRICVQTASQRLGDRTITFDDQLAGFQTFDLFGRIGDFVVRRTDGVAAYQVACAFDDVMMGCTEVIRGCDLLPSAARQIMLLRLLGLPEPMYGHVGLVLASDGERLSKRHRSTAIRDLRESGIAAEQVLRTLAVTCGLPDTSDLDLLTEAYGSCHLSAHDVQMPEGLIEL